MATKKRCKRPPKNSLAWFEERWTATFTKTSRSKYTLIKLLARLSFDNHRLHERQNALEEAFEEVFSNSALMNHNLGLSVSTLAANQTRLETALRASSRQSEASFRFNDGMVKIEGDPHLRECERVIVPGSRNCTCGSVPACKKPN